MAEVELQIPGDDATFQLNSALESVQRIIPYLRATAHEVDVVSAAQIVPDEGMYVACDALIGDPDRLKAVIEHTGHQLGTDDPMVAASLFVQSYSYRILTLAVACATTSGVLPNSSASSMAIALKGGRVSLVAYTRPQVLVVTAPEQSVPASLVTGAQLTSFFNVLHSQAIDHHLALLINSTRSTTRVGERLLWGNVAASLAVAFRTMEGSLGPWVQEVGNYFIDHAPARFRGLGSFLLLENRGRQGWFWERTNCCLYDRLPGDVRCSDCSRTPSQTRREAYRASLEQS
jgi:ferric iron reductase protein FhuF